MHGKVKVSLDERDRERVLLEGGEGVRLERVDEVRTYGRGGVGCGCGES